MRHLIQIGFSIFGIVLSIWLPLSHGHHMRRKLEPYSKSLQLGQELETAYQASPTSSMSDYFRNSLVDSTFASSGPLINKTLSSMNEQVNHPIPDARHFCKKDYTGMCPDGWEQKGNRPICLAPASYKGPCATVLPSPGDWHAKANLEQACRLSWACVEFCDRDYTALCPKSWTTTSAMLCRAPTSYTDRCSREKDFTHFTPELKKSWSQACNVLWSCKARCAADYTASCPEGWIISETKKTSCKSPDTYTGPCGPEEALSGLDTTLKKLFEERCNTPFPCKKETCDKDYGIICPKDWLYIVNDESCEAPDHYVGKCTSKLFSAEMSEEEKQQQEMLCDIQWPCRENCTSSYDEPCPVHWIQKSSVSMPTNKINTAPCMPLPEYKGPCNGPKRLWDKTPEMKAAFAEHCQAPWRCIGQPLISQLKPSEEKVEKKGANIHLLGINGPFETAIGRIVNGENETQKPLNLVKNITKK